jgi:hypothetical protein
VRAGGTRHRATDRLPDFPHLAAFGGVLVETSLAKVPMAQRVEEAIRHGLNHSDGLPRFLNAEITPHHGAMVKQ